MPTSQLRCKWQANAKRSHVRIAGSRLVFLTRHEGCVIIAHLIVKDVFLMRVLVSSFLILLPSFTTVLAQDLTAFKDTYEKQMEVIVLEHGVRIGQLNDTFNKSLSALSEGATKAGNLDRVKEVMLAIERFSASHSLTGEEVKDSSYDLKQLQIAYMQDAERLETSKARKILTLTRKYDAALAKLQSHLTKQKKLDDATAVQNERKSARSRKEFLESKSLMAANQENNKTSALSLKSPPLSRPLPVECRMPKDVRAVVETLTRGAKVNTNRDYNFKEVDLELSDMQFLQLPHGVHVDYKIKASSAASLYLLVYDNGEAARYEKEGWVRTNLTVKINWTTPSFIVLSRNVKRSGYIRIRSLPWINPIVVSEQLKIK